MVLFMGYVNFFSETLFLEKHEAFLIFKLPLNVEKHEALRVTRNANTFSHYSTLGRSEDRVFRILCSGIPWGNIIVCCGGG
jgi:hypothetical protein